MTVMMIAIYPRRSVSFVSRDVRRLLSVVGA